jgi:hypothetical protein
MKGVLELNWVLLLIIIGGLAAFLLMLAFTLGYVKNISDLIVNFKVSDFVDIWKRVLAGK